MAALCWQRIRLCDGEGKETHGFDPSKSVNCVALSRGGNVVWFGTRHDIYRSATVSTRYSCAKMHRYTLHRQ